jgi:hypothetical protein
MAALYNRVKAGDGPVSPARKVLQMATTIGFELAGS